MPRRGIVDSLVTVLELDHVFCMVTDPRRAAERLEDDGWVLDAGQAHHGQGTRNRRLAWRERFFELLWVTDAAEARANPLQLDRRADWASTGASPIGLAFRVQIEPEHSDEFWLYDALWTAHLDSSRQRALPGTSSGVRARSRRRTDAAAPTTGVGLPGRQAPPR
jgi:hypothetical protein